MFFKEKFIFLLILFINLSCGGKEDLRPNDTEPQLESSIVDMHGLLRVMGNKIVNKNNIPISLAGNSFFWSNDNWGGERFYNSSTVEWLKADWNAKIVRAAMGIEDPGGYLDNKQSNKERLKTVVNSAIDEGIYVIIDWHSQNA